MYSIPSNTKIHKKLDGPNSPMVRSLYQVLDKSKESLFGIIQGSTYDDLRKECAEEIIKRDLPGIAIGGVSVGEGPELMEQAVSATAPLLPDNKPRYVMGVGNPEDLLMIWENGIDMSDCIIPTKFGRGGTLFTRRGKIRIRHRNYRRLLPNRY